MEGGGTVDGFRFRNLQNKTSILYRASPPLTAIERFLLGKNHISQNKGISIIPGIHHGNFPSFGGAIGSNSGGLSWPSWLETNKTLSWTHHDHDDQIDPNVGLSDQDKSSLSTQRNVSKGVGKRSNGGSSTTLIKGQWTDEEDMNLLKLVKQHGVRKWAQVAEKMVGRAGKQCRERWHNHLRPDIKKDTWSEEEEKVLVEIHKKVGNKWAEIAKRIPGRTENSIKNHWNATKRRQNSKRKIKKPQGQNGRYKSSVLQDYIRSMNMNESTTNKSTATATTTAATVPTSSTVTRDFSNNFPISLGYISEPSIDDSQQYVNQTYDEELNFMVNFFRTENDQPSSSDYYYNNKTVSVIEAKTVQNDDARSTVSVFDPFKFNKSIPDGDQLLINGVVGEGGFSSSNVSSDKFKDSHKEEIGRTHHLSSDLYLSHLLDRFTASPSMDCYYDNDNTKMGSINGDVASSSSSFSGKKDMDLMEMVDFCP